MLDQAIKLGKAHRDLLAAVAQYQSAALAFIKDIAITDIQEQRVIGIMNGSIAEITEIINEDLIAPELGHEEEFEGHARREAQATL